MEKCKKCGNNFESAKVEIENSDDNFISSDGFDIFIDDETGEVELRCKVCEYPVIKFIDPSKIKEVE